MGYCGFLPNFLSLLYFSAWVIKYCLDFYNGHIHKEWVTLRNYFIPQNICMVRMSLQNDHDRVIHHPSNIWSNRDAHRISMLKLCFTILKIMLLQQPFQIVMITFSVFIYIDISCIEICINLDPIWLEYTISYLLANYLCSLWQKQ